MDLTDFEPKKFIELTYYNLLLLYYAPLRMINKQNAQCCAKWCITTYCFYDIILTYNLNVFLNKILNKLSVIVY